MLRRERGIRRARDGSYAVRLEKEERRILASLPGQLREPIAAGDPAVNRLFPRAFEHDDAAEREYRSLVHEGLRDAKLESLRILEQTALDDRLGRPELEAWLGALESLRLVLGTQLDVREDTYAAELDPSDPDTPRLALYAWLSWLQEEAVAALSSSLPEPRAD